MTRRIKFILIGALVLLIMIGVLSLDSQNSVESTIVPTEITPRNITGPVEFPEE